MTQAAAPADSPDCPPAFFHHDSGALRFWVPMPDGPPMGAAVAAQALHYRFHAALDGSDAVATYAVHRDALDAAVRRRVAAGSIEPVFVREHDLKPPHAELMRG